MATDIATRLKEAAAAPVMQPTEEDPFAGEQAKAGRQPRATRGVPKRERTPFAEQVPPEGPEDFQPEPVSASPGPDRLGEIEIKVKLLWDEYEQRQREVDKPKTMKYRCLGYRPDGAPCGMVVEAGTPEMRLQTHEVVRCPHGPDSPADGILFDRERFPKFHYDLTPMEPIQ